MKAKWFSIFLVFAMLVISLASGGTAFAGGGGGGGNQSDAPNNAPRVDTQYALVQLSGDPLATYVQTKPPRGKKIDFNSSAVKSYRAQLSALRNDFKAWLRANAPKVKVTGEFDISLNAVSVKLNGTSLAKLASAPMVMRAEYQGLYYPTDANDPDLSLIHAIEAWNQVGGGANAGAGVKVAIIDSGIDINHPCFSDEGYPAMPHLGDPRFTNNKVIAAKVFHNKASNQGYTAEAIHYHGTHVAGTVACNLDTPATVDGVDIPYDISGVAPAALLGNYNVFPADVPDARSEDIMNALEAAYADGFDVANMSLGGGASGIQDLLAMAVDNMDLANMVVAVSAGNDGPGHFTMGSPGSAARALTAGASSVGHLVASPVTVDGVTAPAIAGEFEVVSEDLTAPLGVVTEAPTNAVTDLSTACGPLATILTGKIALVSRGTCSFSTKIRNVQAAGAVAVLISNNLAGDGIPMAQDGTPNQPTIPAYNVSLTDGAALKVHDGESTTISVNPAYFDTDNDNFMADFSSQGPTDVDFRVKPDVVAPGVNVLSSFPVSFCEGEPCFAFLNGTSMASPHLAGSAAVVRQLHPDWSAAEIRSAIVNTAVQGVLKKSTSVAGAPETDVNIVGAGLENLQSALNAVVTLDPVSVSFGAVPSGSGQTQTFTLTLTNLTGSAQTFDVAVGAGSGGVAFSVSPSSLNLAAGASGAVTVTMSADKGAGSGDHQATLTVSSGGIEIAHAAVYTLIK